MNGLNKKEKEIKEMTYPELLNTEIKKISSNDFRINVWLKTGEDEND